MTFSERHGYKKVREIIQRDSVDDLLRNGLWNLLTRYYWIYARPINKDSTFIPLNSDDNWFLKLLCEKLYMDYWKRPIDEIHVDFTQVRNQIRHYFFDCPWYEVYDFIEYIANNTHSDTSEFQSECNKILEREMSAFRFVDGLITPIVGVEEVESIEQALTIEDNSVYEHLKMALKFLSDREQPNYRNSIKESISAVESLASKVIGDKPELGKLLNKFNETGQLHPALTKAFQNLYGYTSDEGGIRHAMIEGKSEVDFHDAKFMLVACSAFINFIVGKLEL